jgi:hypothetical protein
LMCTALASLMSPAIHASHASGVGRLRLQPPGPGHHLPHRMPRRRHRQPDLHRRELPRLVPRLTTRRFQPGQPMPISPLTRVRELHHQLRPPACAFDRTRSAAFNDSTSMAC